jgi:hypothetical protein
MDEITVKPDTTLREYQECVKEWHKAYVWSRSTKGTLWMLLAVGAGALSFSVAETWGSLPSGAGAVALVAFAIALAMNRMIPAQINSQILRKVYRRMHDVNAVYTFTPDRVRWVGQNAQADFSWDYFDSVVEKNNLYLFIRGNSVMCIPKRSIPTDRLQDFAAIVRDHVPSHSNGGKRLTQIGP